MLRWLAVIVLVATGAIVLVTLFGDDAFGTLKPSDGDGIYLTTFGLVAADAVIPIFPGETTLNAAATLAADGDAELIWVILSGGLGAIVGDSVLYWIARRSSARVEPQIERARRNDRINSALDFLDRGAPVMLTFGRYVPGLRFVINSTMGMTHYPYRKFLPLSALGGMLWSAYTCVLAYKVGSTLDNYPVASIVIAQLITAAVLAAAFLFVRRRDAAQAAADAATTPDQ